MHFERKIYLVLMENLFNIRSREFMINMIWVDPKKSIIINIC